MLTECRRRRAPIWPRLLTLVGSHPRASHPGAPRAADPHVGLCRNTKRPCAHALLKDVGFWASVMRPRCRHACSTGVLLGNPCISPHPHSCMRAPPRPAPCRLGPRRLVQHGSGIGARQPCGAGGDAGPLAPTRRRHGRTGQGVRSACVRHAF